MIQLLGSFILFFALAEGSAEQPAQDLQSHLVQVIEAQVSNECTSCSVDVQVHNPQAVDDIAIPDKVISDRWKGQTNLILKTGKENRVVTVTIRWQDKVVVAKKNIKQGQIIKASELRTVDKDVTYIKTAYANDIKNVVGMTGGRVFKRGQIIDEAVLRKPIVVRYGQPIKLFIDEGSLSLTMSGRARGAGAIGDRIPVFIPNTRKKLFAVIIDKSTARVE